LQKNLKIRNEKLSKINTTPVNSKDIFFKYQENMDKMFNNVKRSVPVYHQSTTNVQQEFLQSFENMVNLSIPIQKEFVEKMGITSNIPVPILHVIDNLSEEFVKVTSVQNQIILTIFDAIQQNIKISNDNVKSFTDLNKNILYSWISVFTPKCN
jgi:hypothetical protein|tara:strand:- start:224 stop:685 length:462 start_codon:yes stop_codon:yes gene_type:complete